MRGGCGAGGALRGSAAGTRGGREVLRTPVRDARGIRRGRRLCGGVLRAPGADERCCGHPCGMRGGCGADGDSAREALRVSGVDQGCCGYPSGMRGDVRRPLRWKTGRSCEPVCVFGTPSRRRGEVDRSPRRDLSGERRFCGAAVRTLCPVRIRGADCLRPCGFCGRARPGGVRTGAPTSEDGTPWREWPDAAVRAGSECCTGGADAICCRMVRADQKRGPAGPDCERRWRQ